MVVPAFDFAPHDLTDSPPFAFTHFWRREIVSARRGQLLTFRCRLWRPRHNSEFLERTGLASVTEKQTLNRPDSTKCKSVAGLWPEQTGNRYGPQPRHPLTLSICPVKPSGPAERPFTTCITPFSQMAESGLFKVPVTVPAVLPSGDGTGLENFRPNDLQIHPPRLRNALGPPVAHRLRRNIAKRRNCESPAELINDL